MFTVCPKCTLTLVVTTVDLRAGQGYVRCGRCTNVFNALIALREGEPANGTSDSAKRRLLETEPRPPVEPALGSGVAIDPEPEPEPKPELDPEPVFELEPEPEPELELEPTTFELPADTEAPVTEDQSLEFDAASTDVSEIFIEVPSGGELGSGNYEAIVLGEESSVEPETIEAVLEQPVPEEEPAPTHTAGSGEWSLLDDDPPEEQPLDDESASAELPGLIEESTENVESGGAEEPAPDPAWVEEMFAEAEAVAGVKQQRTGEHAAQAEIAPPDGDNNDAEAAEKSAPAVNIEPLLTAPVRKRAPWQYLAGVSLLALVLVGQIVHHNRQALVLNPTIGGTVTKVYSWFGVTLVPRWDLSAYAVKQLGAVAEGTDGTRLRVRLSVQNTSTRVQPLPLVRLTLKDRYANPVATRDLEPDEYLPARAAGQRLLEPDQRIDAELQVADPGRAAIGFEIDACLRAENGAIGCASDARKPPAG